MTANSLPDVFRALNLPRSARALDIGGSAYDGEESIRQLVEAIDGPVDVVLAKPEHAAALTAKFGHRIRLVESEHAAGSGGYDVVVVSPVLGKIAETLADARWRGPRVLRAGGAIVSFGIDPTARGAEAVKQPDPKVAEDFAKLVVVTGGEVTALRDPLADRFDLMGIWLRKPVMRSYLTWVALRLRPAAPSNPCPDDWLLDGLDAGLDDAAIDKLVREHAPDVLMIVDTPVTTDARVMKTAGTVSGLVRRVLCVGLNRDARLGTATLAGGAPVLQLPNPRVELDRRLRTIRAPMDHGLRRTLRMEAFGRMLGRLLRRLARPGLVVHSHDFQALYAAGVQIEALRREDPGAARGVRWIHDIHEFVADYDLIDPSVQARGEAWERRFLPKADVLTAVSEEQAERLAAHYGVAPPIVIHNAPPAPTRTRRGPTVRQALGLEGRVVLVHSGSIRQGRGVEHVVRVLPALPQADLVLLTGSDDDFTRGLLAEAEALRVADRVHRHPPVPFDEVADAIADADVGLIPMDSYGNSELSLPNKLFDYLQAGLPIVSSATGSLARFFRDWPIGPLFAPGDEAGLLTALRDALANRARYAAAIASRPDLIDAYSWEAQAAKLQQIYDRLSHPSAPNP